MKYKLVEKIIQSDDDVLLNQVKTVLGIKDSDFREDLSPEMKSNIHAGEGGLKGSGISHDQLVDEIKSYLK